MRLVALLLSAAAGVAVAAPAALANGDPPSNVLIAQDVYTPADPAPPALARELRQAAARARDAGYPTKVAVVRTNLDLGNVPQALDQPQQYADYLVTDLRGPSHVTDDFAVLVVTPSGAGIAGKSFNSGERRAARTIAVSTGAGSGDLVRAATATLEKMAAAGGHSIGGAGSGGGGGSSGAMIAAVLVGLLALTAVAILAARARRRGEAPPADE
jgi:hypothetical protein